MQRKNFSTRKPVTEVKKNTDPSVRLISNYSDQIERVIHESSCKILESCGLCPLIDESYKKQLQQKNQKLKSSLQAISSVYPALLIKDCVSSEKRFEYRQTIELSISEHLSHEKRWVDVGYYSENLRQVIDIGRCPIQTKIINDIIAWLRTGIRVHNISAYSLRNKEGLLRSVIIKSSDYSKQCLVILVASRKDLVPLRALARDISEKYMNIQGVFLKLIDDKKNESFLLSGQDFIEEAYSHKLFKMSASCQFPINPSIFAKIYTRIESIADLSENEKLLILNCGAGILANLMSNSSREIYATDDVKTNIDLAKLNSNQLGFSNNKFLLNKAEDGINDILLQNPSILFSHTILTTQGYAPTLSLLEKVSKLTQKGLFYIVPHSQDISDHIKKLTKYSFQPIFIEPFDSMPGSNHFEVLCYFSKIN